MLVRAFMHRVFALPFEPPNPNYDFFDMSTSSSLQILTSAKNGTGLKGMCI